LERLLYILQQKLKQYLTNKKGVTMWILMDIESGEAMQDISCLTKLYFNFADCKKEFDDIKKEIRNLNETIEGSIYEDKNTIILDSEDLFKKVEIKPLQQVNIISG
jgi:hypothetical protein